MGSSGNENPTRKKKQQPIWKGAGFWIIGILIAIIVVPKLALFNNEPEPEGLSSEFHSNAVEALYQIDYVFEGNSLDENDKEISWLAKQLAIMDEDPTKFSQEEKEILKGLQILFNGAAALILHNEGVEVLDSSSLANLEQNYQTGREIVVERLNVMDQGGEQNDQINDGSLSSDTNNNVEWNYYNNERFGFNVPYPSTWNIREEAANGDGLVLYQGDDAEISVYASNYMEDFEPDLSDYEVLLNENGKEVYTSSKENENEVIYDGVILNGNIEFHLSGTLSLEFYNDNIEILNDMLLNTEIE